MTPTETSAETEAADLPAAAVLVAILLVGLGVLARILASSSELWLDEIWTLYGTRELGTAGEVFTKFWSSNNHHLYSLFYYALGDQGSWFLYRLPSLIAGTLTIPLVWLVTRPAGRLGAAVAATLTATSYVMIHFASEARGYSLVVFFAVATLYTARRYLEGFRWSWAILFWLCPCLGFLSHLMYSLAFAGACIWLPVQLFMMQRQVRGALLRSLQVLGVPIAFFAWFYLSVVRHIAVGGGPLFTWPAILTKTLSYAGGGPASGPVATVVALLTAAIFVYVVIRMRKEGSGEWLFFGTVIFVAPALTLLAQQPDVMFVRYFVISMVLSYVAVGYWAASLCRRGQQQRMAIGIALLLFVIGNGVNVANLLRHGRGAYTEGMRFMVENTPGDVVTFTTDHAPRNGLVMDYYKRFIKTEKQFRHMPDYPATVPPPVWLILHRIGEFTDIRENAGDRYGNAYVLVRHVPYSDMSGWHWFLYRLKAPGERR